MTRPDTAFRDASRTDATSAPVSARLRTITSRAWGLRPCAATTAALKKSAPTGNAFIESILRGGLAYRTPVGEACVWSVRARRDGGAAAPAGPAAASVHPQFLHGIEASRRPPAERDAERPRPRQDICAELIARRIDDAFERCVRERTHC